MSSNPTTISSTPSIFPPTSSGQHVLLPHRAPSNRKHQTILVEVSSRDRNFNSLEFSNPFRFTFPRPLKDVQSVELLSGTIPANPFNIVQGRNSFTFQENASPPVSSAQWVLTLPPGFYTPTSLLTKLNSLFAALGASNTYIWSLNPNTNSLELTRTSGSLSFSLLFASGISSDTIDRTNGSLLNLNTPAILFGFDMADYSSDTASSIQAPYPLDLSSATNRIYLYINFQNSINLSAIERGSGRRPPFAIIYLDEQTNGYKYLNKDTLTPASYSLPQPFSRLQDLYIDFRDEFYKPIHFNGKDVSLLLQFTTLE